MRAADARGNKREKENTLSGRGNRGQKTPKKESNCSKIHFSERRDSEETHSKSYCYFGHHKCHVRCAWDCPPVPARLMQTLSLPNRPCLSLVSIRHSYNSMIIKTVKVVCLKSGSSRHSLSSVPQHLCSVKDRCMHKPPEI